MRLYGTSASINLTDSTLPEREKKGLSLTNSLRAVARLFRSFILSRTTQRLRRLSPKLFLRYFHEKKETETEREREKERNRTRISFSLASVHTYSL